MQPIRYDPDGVPVFTNLQIDDYGLPDEWGYDTFRIVETQSTGYFGMDYKFISEYERKEIHHYSSRQRFENTLQQLLGLRGNVPTHILKIVAESVDTSKPDIWEQVRKVLKENRLSLYYNRIPVIIYHLCKKSPVVWSSKNMYDEILNDYKSFCYTYNSKKENLGRKYFPNMRFISLKFIEKHGGKFNYEIPYARTLRKRKDLEKVWNIF